MGAQCSRCGTRENIGWDASRDKPARLCRSCHAESARHSYARARQKNIRKQIIRDHKITEERLQQLERQADGLCMICKSPPESKPLCLDHSHATGEVRGLICNRCNSGLGYFKDSAELLRAAAEYLDRRRA